MDSGEVEGGHVVIFLHGNPSHGLVWSPVMDIVAPLVRCLAWDQIGFGWSGKIRSNFTFDVNYSCLEGWIKALNLPRGFHFVVHDWGSTLGFRYTHLHPDEVLSMTFMEPVIFPLPTWEQFPASWRWWFQLLKSEQGKNTLGTFLKSAHLLVSFTTQELVYT